MSRCEDGIGGAERDPVAVVGIGCRLPGDVHGPDDLWDLIEARRETASGFPTNRGWDPGLFEPGTTRAGRTYAPRAGFLHEAGDFDADFFGISPREARVMDPQQRLWLETCWEALEHAGIDPETLSGSLTGVYAGTVSADYHPATPDDDPAVEGLRVTGAVASVVAGRVAYALGIEGPAVTVDTACSSSLSAIHLACSALRNGECTLALAGGVTVMPDPWFILGFARFGGLSKDAKTRSFAEGANGVVLAEGSAALAVELLSEARRRGHRVLGLIRGSAIGQDGASKRFTAPRGAAHERVVERALHDAGLAPGDISLIEGHGSGTPLGDPIEAEALIAAYGRDRAGDPAWLGSVKPNIGHALAAAGAVGVIKVLMAMRHRTMPASLYTETPTSKVDWTGAGVRLLSTSRPWDSGNEPRRAGVSALGMNGTHTHLVLEEAPAPAAQEDARTAMVTGAAPWVLSARSVEALREQAGRLARIAEGSDADTVAVAAALATRRSVFRHRASVAASGRVAALEALAEGRPTAETAIGVARHADPGGAVLVFPGQGAQRAGMAVGLAEASPVFARALDACEAALEPHVDWSLREVLRASDEPSAVEVVQPALFAVMVALAETWIACGLEPAAVIGHSQGEIAAAVVSGALTLDDGARIVAGRSHALRAVAGLGGMVAVSLDERQALDALAPFGDALTIAAVNGPAGVVIAGDDRALQNLVAECAATGVRTNVLAVDYAAHSAHVEPVTSGLRAGLAGIVPGPGTIPFWSTVTGDCLDGAALDADYWVRNVREPVRFGDTAAALLAAGHRRFVEVSPHPVLTVPIRDAAEARNIAPQDLAVVGSLHRDRADADVLLDGLGTLWAAGGSVDWAAIHGSGHAWVDLPTYPFQRTRHWLLPLRQQGVTKGEAGAVDGLNVVTWEPTGRGVPAPVDGVAVLRGLDAPRRELEAALEASPDGHVPEVVVVSAGTPAPDAALGAHDLAKRTVEIVRAALEHPRLHDTRFVFLTRAAVAVDADDRVLDVAAAAVWGVLRSAEAEHPGRFWVVDSDVDDPSAHSGLTPQGEPQIALRRGDVHVPRLRPVRGLDRRPRFRADGTVLVTGATGALGGLLAKHLVREYGVRHLLLLSRRGQDAPRAASLVGELEDLGAEVDLVACDVGDRDSLAAVLARVPDRHPLRAVIHTAGVRRDATITNVDGVAMDEVLRPKVDGAWALHELTAAGDLDEFVLFSSAAGTIENPGQASYAAGNAVLDAIAGFRRSSGLAGLSIAWGWWGVEGDMGADLDPVNQGRLRRQGLQPMSAAGGLRLFDAAIKASHPVVVTAAFDLTSLPDTTAGELPAVMRGLLEDTSPGTQSETPGASEPEVVGAFVEEQAPLLVLALRRASSDAHESVVSAFVREAAASVLGHADVEGVDPDRAFKELGFDSLAAVDLRNRISDATGLRLPTTFVFDYPSINAVSANVLERLEVEADEPHEDRIRAVLQTVPLERLREAGLLDELLALVEDEPEASAVLVPVTHDDIDDLAIDGLIERAMTEDH